MVEAGANSVGAMGRMGSHLRGHWHTYWYWFRKATATMFDQGLISGSNFLLTLTLAKWLGPTEYGAYAIMFSVFLLLGNLHQALLLEPMSVFQPSVYPEQRREYIGSVLWLHAILSAIFMAGMAVTAVVFSMKGLPILANAATGVIAGVPCILLLWTARAASYLDCRPAKAAMASVLYCAVLMTSLVLVYRAKVLSPLVTYSLMSLAALTTGLFLLKQLRPVMGSGRSPGIAEVWKRHWDYGRWSLAGVGVQWLDINCYYLLTGTFLGIREAGAVAALVSFMLPINHIMAGSSRLLLPYLARTASTKGPLAIGRITQRFAFGFFGMTALYWALISILRYPAMHLLYGSKFLEFAPYVPWALLCFNFASATFPRELGLRAVKAPSVLVRSSCVSATFSVIIGTTLVWRFGFIGVFLATASVSMIHLTVVNIFFRWEMKRLAAQQDRHLAAGAVLQSSKGARQLPVLVYHHVGPRRRGVLRSLTVSPRRFERQIAVLARSGYTTPSEAQVLSWLRGESELPPKSVMLTFDDAYKDICVYALPVLKRHGFTALIFVVTGQIGGTNAFDRSMGGVSLQTMSADDIAYWAGQGFDFGSHTRGHRRLPMLSAEELAHEIEGSRLDFEEVLKRPAISFAYPYGAFDETTEFVAKKSYRLLFTTERGVNTRGTSAARIHRTVTHHMDTIADTVCRARWGWSPIEVFREGFVSPVRPLLTAFRSRYVGGAPLIEDQLSEEGPGA